MSDYEYKEDIRASRVGSLGSSDGAMLMQIASIGEIPNGALKRLAVCKGITPFEEIPHTRAMAYGDFIEQSIYEHLHTTDERYQSNPLWVSKKYSKDNVRLISHPDIILYDVPNKVLYIYEVKTTKDSLVKTRAKYTGQLSIHQLLGDEQCAELGKGWVAKVFLVHYDTNDVDLDAPFEFDPSRMTIQRTTNLHTSAREIVKAMGIVSTFMETFTDYYDEEIDALMLPTEVKAQFDEITMFLREIKEREEKVNAFRKRLYSFLTERNIKKVSCDAFSFSVVAPSKQVSWDSKGFLADLEKEHPKKAKKIREKYTKITDKAGYVLVKVKEEKQ